MGARIFPREQYIYVLRSRRANNRTAANSPFTLRFATTVIVHFLPLSIIPAPHAKTLTQVVGPARETKVPHQAIVRAHRKYNRGSKATHRSEQHIYS